MRTRAWDLSNRLLSNSGEHCGWVSLVVTGYGNAPTENKASAYMKATHGFAYYREMGAHDGWTATKAERDTFTGVIGVTHHSWVIPDDLAPSYAVDLLFVNGVLEFKKYGYLPG